MAVRRVQLRRGTTAQNNAFRGVEGEITVDTETKSIRVHDGNNNAGFDLMRADMSNNLAVVGNINFTDDDHTIGGAIDGNTLTLGQVNTAISIPGTLTVANYVTENDLLIQDKVIVIADGTEGAANSTDSIGLLFTRTTDGPGPGAAQNPALFYWDEATDRFRIETNNVTEEDADWSAGATGSDLTLGTLYAQTSVDVNNGNITNVGQIALDEITFADAGAFITITAEDALDGKAFNLKDGGGTEYLTINTNAESTTLGVVAKTTTFLSNDIDIGSDAANDVVIEVVARTGDNDGQDLTIKAGSAADSDDNLGGDLILASGSGVEVGGTSSIQFQTKVDGTVGVSEAMRIHTTGYVGIGENAPDSGLHIKGNDAKAVLTLENSTGGNAQDDDPTTISFKGSGEALALAQIVGAHDGAADDDKGVLIFKPNNDGGTTEALRLDSSLKATFAGNVKISGTGTNALDFTDANVTIGATLDTDKALTLGGGTVKTTGDLTVEGSDVVLGTDGGGATTLKAETTAGGAGNNLTISSGVGNNAGTNDGDLVLASGAQTGLTIEADQKATFAGAVEIATSLDMTTGAINNVTDIDLDKITDRNNDGIEIELTDNIPNALIVRQGAAGEQYLNVTTSNGGILLTLAQATSLSSSLTVAGASNLNGGITVDTDNFTVDGATGAIDTKSTLQVDGNTTLGANGLAGSPNLTIVEHTGGATKFQVVGASGNTTVGGTLGVTGISTLSDTLKIVQGVADGIIFNSDRGAENDQDAALIKVLDDSDDGNDGVLSWDDGLGSFSFSGSKLNSVLDFSVGTLATPSTTISATTGAIATAGTAPYLTLKNTTGGNDNGDSETRVIFQDDAGQSLAQIQGSHDGGVDDTKGDLIFSTNSGGGLVEALRLDSANLATFAGSATVSGGTITVGGNGATIVATNANLLTITEDTVATSAALTVGTNLTVGGNILGDDDDDRTIFAQTTTLAKTITLGGGGTVVVGGSGSLRLSSTNIIENSASETTITLNANQRTTLSGDLAVVGGATGGLAATTILLGADAARDSKISVVARTGAANAGQNLTIEAGSSATGGNNLNGGNLTLASGGGDGTGTSDIILNTKTNGTDSATEKVRILGSGNVGIGDTAPGTMLQISGADAYLTLKNTTPENDEGGAETKIIFEDHGNNALAQIEGSHHGTDDDDKGKLILSVNDDNGLQTALTIDSTKLATFAGAVTVAGDLTVQGDTTTVNTATLDVVDAVIRLNKGVADLNDGLGGANTNDIGIFFERGTDGDDGIFFWGDDESYFILGTTTEDDHTVVDFAGTTTPGGLQIATIEMRDNIATSFVIQSADDDAAYITFNTLNADGGQGNEQVEFGKIFTAQTGSKIGNLTLANGSITDSGGTVSFGTNHIDTTGLASLDGGINVLDKFTVDNAGATVVLNTLTLNEATGNLSDFDVQSNGTSVFKVDVSELDAIVGATSTLFTNKIQATSDANDSFQMYLKDNTDLGLVVSNVSDNVDFITVKTTTNSELITLVQATSISETLEVVGNATFDAEVHIETANANGIFFNQDGVGNGSADATLITIEGGNDKTDVVLAWDTSDDAINLNAQSSLHLQGVAGGDALTIGGVLKTNATASIKTDGSAVFTSVNAGNTITNAGAVSGVTSIAGTSMDITLANDDADALEVMGDVGAGDAGDHAYLSFVTTNEAEEVVVNQEAQVLKFRVEGGAEANLIVTDPTNNRVGVKTAAPNFDLDITGTLGVSGLADLNGGIDVNGSNFTVSDAGVVVSVGGITDTTVASAFKDGTLLGNVTYNDNEIVGANAQDLTIKSKQDIIFNIDSDNNDNAGKKFSFSHNENAEIASINDSGDLTLAGDLTVSGGDATITGIEGGSVTLNLVADEGDDNGDAWKVVVADHAARTLTISGQNVGDANYTDILTLTANDTGTSTNASFAGEITVLGGKVNLTHGSIIDSTTEGTLLLTEDIVKTSGDLQVGGNDIINANGDTVITFAGAGVSTTLTATTTIASGILQVNGNITGDADEAKSIFATTTTEGNLITLGGGGTVKTAGKLRVTGNHIEDSGNSTAIQFDGSQNTTINGNLTVDGLLTGSSTTGHVSFRDRILALATSNASSSGEVGFYGIYRDVNDAEYYNGLLYSPDSTAGGALGSWKLFHKNTDINDTTDVNVTITDAQLGILDTNTVRGGSAKGTDNTAGANLTISGGLSTGNATGGTIVFKTGGTGAGAAVENTPTTALTIDNAQKTTLNVAGAGLDITKTTGLTGDEDTNNAPLFTTNTRAFQVTMTTHTAIADDAHSIGFLVNNSSVSSSSVIMATVASATNGGDILTESGIEVYAHSLTNVTSFEFSLVNRTGSEIATDSAIVINFVIL